MKPEIGTPKGISDMLDAMENRKNLFPDERAAIEMVLNLGETYGFGNLIAWLKTAWAMRLRDHHKIQTVVALASADASPYPLPPSATAMNYPNEIWADTDLVCDDKPHEGWVRYIRALADTKERIAQ